MNNVENTSKVVTRFAPSPTGYVHIGGIRTALFAYLLARQNKGIFILRIEDTDRARIVDGSLEHIQESLRWLGLDWDFGPNIPGPFGSTIQSERRETYIPWAKKLIEKGLAYPDPYTQEEVEEFRKKAQDEKRVFLYRDHRPEIFGVWDGKTALRYKVPEIKRYEWFDEARGKLSAGPEALDDIVIMKADGYPVYALAHIIDDYNMGITHILRSDEWISSIPRFLSLYESLEIPPPIQATLPPILRDDRTKKLGKRDGAKDVLDYKKEGYLPIAILNYIALIGWNPGTEQEIFTLDELIKAFSIERIQKSGGAFDEEKLNWFNREHMKKIPVEEHFALVKEFLPKELLGSKDYDEVMLAKLTPLIWERISYFGEIKKMYDDGELGYFFADPKIDSDMLIWKSLKNDIDALNKTKEILGKEMEILEKINIEDWTLEEIKAQLWPLAEEIGKGEVLWPLRVALSGREKSPDPFQLADILGKEVVIRRLKSIV